MNRSMMGNIFLDEVTMSENKKTSLLRYLVIPFTAPGNTLFL